jgi:hypothetical protein
MALPELGVCASRLREFDESKPVSPAPKPVGLP